MTPRLKLTAMIVITAIIISTFAAINSTKAVSQDSISEERRSVDSTTLISRLYEPLSVRHTTLWNHSNEFYGRMSSHSSLIRPKETYAI